MELGGKAPAIVLPSANLQLAANHVSFVSIIYFHYDFWR